MDNCSIHKSGKIEKLIEVAGAKLIYLPPYSPEVAGAKLIYLPPYSPDFSPIENCCSKIKNILRSIGARSYPDLAKTIVIAFAKSH